MRICKDIFWIIFSLAAVEIGGVQQFLKTPSYTEVDPGADALLKCQISEKKGICSWQKDNKPVGMYHGKYEWVSVRSIVQGDCSLWVRAAKIEIDDGKWQCQVTASSYNAQDALSSVAAQLVVRASPGPPQILHDGSPVHTDTVFTVAANSRVTFACEVRYGNPPAHIEWYIGKSRVTAWHQRNVSEVDQPRVWSARSVLELNATRLNDGRQLACKAHHPSYPAPHYRNAIIMLNVTYVPTVYIVGADPNTMSSLEEGASDLSLNCKADGNPKAYVWWTKKGDIISTNRPKLFVTPVTRNDSGVYGCQAKNSVGTSDTVKVEIDVKFAPRIKHIGPETIINANLHTQVTMECNAEGNPMPTYQWYYCPGQTAVNSISEEGNLISSDSHLQLFNISYAERGRYFCVAQNFIGRRKRTHYSEAITVNVLGSPVSLRTELAHGWSGSSASIHATVCANPTPATALWFWGNGRLDIPAENDRFKTLIFKNVDDCYHYSLIIKEVVSSDAGSYILRVGNDRGFVSQSISFTVHENAYVAPLIATTLAAAGLLVLLLCQIKRCRRKKDIVPKNGPIRNRDASHGTHQMVPFVINMHRTPSTTLKQIEFCEKSVCSRNCETVNQSLNLFACRSILESHNKINYRQKLPRVEELFTDDDIRNNYEEISDIYRIDEIFP